MFRFVYFFISISIYVLESPVHSQNSSKHIKLEDFTTIQDGKCDIWVSILLTHHTPKLKPLLVLKQQSSNKYIIIPTLFIHDRNEELNAKCKYAKRERMCLVISLSDLHLKLEFLWRAFRKNKDCKWLCFGTPLSNARVLRVCVSCLSSLSLKTWFLVSTSKSHISKIWLKNNHKPNFRTLLR